MRQGSFYCGHFVFAASVIAAVSSGNAFAAPLFSGDAYVKVVSPEYKYLSATRDEETPGFAQAKYIGTPEIIEGHAGGLLLSLLADGRTGPGWASTSRMADRLNDEPGDKPFRLCRH